MTKYVKVSSIDLLPREKKSRNIREIRRKVIFRYLLNLRKITEENDAHFVVLCGAQEMHMRVSISINYARLTMTPHQNKDITINYVIS